MAGGGMREEDEGEHGVGCGVDTLDWALAAAVLMLTTAGLALVRQTGGADLSLVEILAPIWTPILLLFLYVFGGAAFDTVRDLRRRP